MGVGRLFGGAVGGGSAAPEIPAYTYTGDHLTRLQLYNGVLYAEWELISSGTLTFAADTVADFYLIGGGGNGSGGTAGGGGSGSAAHLLAQNLTASVGLSVVVGGAQGSSQLISSGSTIAEAAGATGVAGYNQPYYLYGDTAYQRGTGSDGTTGSNGIGGAGCTVNPFVASVPAVRSNTALTSGGAPTLTDFSRGAGAGGTSNRSTYSFTAFNLYVDGYGYTNVIITPLYSRAGQGAQGLVLARVQLS